MKTLKLFTNLHMLVETHLILNLSQNKQKDLRSSMKKNLDTKQTKVLF